MCKALLAYWKTKKNKQELARVTQLQEAALAEKQQHEEVRRQRKAQPLGAAAELRPQSKTKPPKRARDTTCERTAGLSAAGRAAYDRAHAQLSAASALVFDTETADVAGSVLNLGWLLAEESGAELTSYNPLWLLPRGERVCAGAFRKHGISEAQVAREGVAAAPELGEFFALVAAALAAGVRVVAHNASFDVSRLNHTAHRHGITGALTSATMLCTMHSATKHCGLRVRGGKRLKAPRNEELYAFLFKRPPPGDLHRALPDCRVTLASYIEGRKRRWW
jgi:DNA polymerase III epsilon subunit-like protein